ncbi:hypothetical protein GEMRC1_010798 [Eukaryota sp. GEM-RC1]
MTDIFTPEACRMGFTPTIFTGNVFVVFGTIISGLFTVVIGGNDVANAIGTTVGSGALSLKKAIAVAAIFEFVGAYFLGANVVSTISGGITDASHFNDPLIFAAGMFAALAAGFFWLLAATLWSVPVSTTHSIVGAIIGFAIVEAGWGSVNWWPNIANIALSWIISPVVGGVIAYLLFKMTTKLCFNAENPIERTISLMPMFFGFSMFIFGLFFSLKGLTNIMEISTSQAVVISAGLGLVAFAVHYLFLRPRMNHDIPDSILDKHRQLLSIDMARPSIDLSKPRNSTIETESCDDANTEVITIDVSETDVSNPTTRSASTVKRVHVNDSDKEHDSEDKTEPQTQAFDHEQEEVFDQKLQDQIIKKLQRKSADKLFAPPAIDIAKSVGPLTAILHVWEHHEVGTALETPIWTLILGGFGLTFGLATLGYKVINTIGSGITKVTNLNGTVIQLSAAVTVLLGSSFGLPVSTSHILVGAVVGQALARKTEVRWKTVQRIAFCMVITLPIACISSYLVFSGLLFGISD